MPKIKMNGANGDEWGDQPKPITKVKNGFRELDKRDGNGFSNKGVWTDKRTGEKYKRNYPAIESMIADKNGDYTLNPAAYTTLNRGSKENKAIDPFYKGNVKGDRMVARLAALGQAKKKAGK